MQKIVTRYETLIRHDATGKLKGGHHVDLVRWVPGDGEAEGDMPPPRLTEAIPLTRDDLSALLAEDAAAALAGFSELKGQELAGRVALAQKDEEIAALRAEIDRLSGERGLIETQLLEQVVPVQTFEARTQGYTQEQMDHMASQVERLSAPAEAAPAPEPADQPESDAAPVPPLPAVEGAEPAPLQPE